MEKEKKGEEEKEEENEEEEEEEEEDEGIEMWQVPQGWKSKLEYVCHFVSLVRSKTPKITIYSGKAKCMLMENLPVADFQVDFATGSHAPMQT